MNDWPPVLSLPVPMPRPLSDPHNSLFIAFKLFIKNHKINDKKAETQNSIFHFTTQNHIFPKSNQPEKWIVG